MNADASSPGLRAKASIPQLLALFISLLHWMSGTDGPSAQEPGRSLYNRLWSPTITLWYLLWQRLQTDPALDAVVKDARAGGADALCDPGKPLSARLRTRATTSFSDARLRLPVRWLARVFTHFGQRLRAQVEGLDWHGLKVILLDGSTVRLRPHGNIPQCFAPASNQHGQGYWCLMRVVAGFCAGSGLAMTTGMGPMGVSEQTLAVSLILRAAAGHLWVGDRNFGIWRVVRAALQARSHALVRLTDVRARRLLGRALADGLDLPLCWTPTRHDQSGPGVERLPAEGRLVVVRLARPGFRPQWLCLFTTLTDMEACPAAELVSLYGVRWQVEVNLRHLKAQMGLGKMEVKSGRMAVRQWYAGLLAYNLVRGVMLWAGATGRVAPLGLSFAQSRRLLGQMLRDWQRGSGPQARQHQWERLIEDVAATGPARHRKPRPSEPRRKRHLPEAFPPLRGPRAAARLKLVESKS